MDWSTWPVSPSYPPLMQVLTRYAIAGRLREQSGVVGDTLEEFLPLAQGRLDVAITTPDEPQRKRPHRGPRGDQRLPLVRYGRQRHLPRRGRQASARPPVRRERAGVHRGAASHRERPEPHQRGRAAHDLSALGLPGAERPARRGPQRRTDGAAEGDDTGRRVVTGGVGMVFARFLLLALLVLSVAEVVLAWWFGHYSSAGVADAAPSVLDTRAARMLASCSAPPCSMDVRSCVGRRPRARRRDRRLPRLPAGRSSPRRGSDARRSAARGRAKARTGASSSSRSCSMPPPIHGWPG